MKRLIADIYKIIYGLTRMSYLSLFIALAYVTVANFIILYGIFLLVQGWLPIDILLKGFQYPYYVVTAIGLFLFQFWLMVPLKNLSKEKKKKPYYWPIFAFTATSIILLVYIHYRSQLI